MNAQMTNGRNDKMTRTGRMGRLKGRNDTKMRNARMGNSTEHRRAAMKAVIQAGQH